jgi:hypothetical protein
MDAWTALNRADVTSSPEMVRFAEGVIAALDDYDPPTEDDLHEIADESVPVYNSEILELVSSSPQLWNRETGLGPCIRWFADAREHRCDGSL